MTSDERKRYEELSFLAKLNEEAYLKTTCEQKSVSTLLDLMEFLTLCLLDEDSSTIDEQKELRKKLDAVAQRRQELGLE
jgi:hypothetical protein